MVQVANKSEVKGKSFAQLFRESLEEERKLKKRKKKKNAKFLGRRNTDGEQTDDDDESNIEPKNMTPTRTGNIAVAKHRNVSYEIKNGQPVFRLRRSPRKSAQNAYLKATHDQAQAKPLSVINNSENVSSTSKASGSSASTPTKRRSSTKLFTPSGNDDYLGASPKGKQRKLPKSVLPSPVKFIADETLLAEDKEDKSYSAVCNIIDNLDNTAAADSSIAEMPSQVI